MIKKVLAIIIPIIVLAFPNAIETICTKGGEIFMGILNPLFELIGNTAQG